MNPLLIVAAAVVLFLIWRKQQDEAAAALGRRPPNGGADGSPQSQMAAAHGGSPVVGNTKQSPDLASALGAGAGVAGCAALGAPPSLLPVCAAVGAKLLPAIGQAGRDVGKHLVILGDQFDPSAEFKRLVLAQGKRDLEALRARNGTGAPLTKEAISYMQESGDGVSAGWSGTPVASTGMANATSGKDFNAPPAPPLGNPPAPTSIGGWGSTTPIAKGPAVESRTGRGRF